MIEHGDKVDKAGAETSVCPLAARLVSVRKQFGYRDVLRGVTLDIPRGGCSVITGPNGAGKSTVLRILGTQWRASEGLVQILGRDLNQGLAWARSKIGLVLHEPFLRREMTLEENLHFAAALYGLDPRIARVRALRLMERFGLAHRRRDLVGTFSQGLLKRSSLARSLLSEPELWLLDEPFSGLDPSGRELLLNAVREYIGGGNGRTVLLVTHELELGSALATHSIRIRDGRVVAVGAGALAMGPTDSSPSKEESPR